MFPQKGTQLFEDDFNNFRKVIFGFITGISEMKGKYIGLP